MSMEGTLSVYEAEALIQSLRAFEVEDIGGNEWLRQHQTIERLNMQAHHSVMLGNDDFVMAKMMSYDKIIIVIENVLAIEIWKDKVFPYLGLSQGQHQSLKPYTALYHEALLCNLLELFFFNKEALFSVGDAIVELTDFCCRKLTLLTARDPSEWHAPARTAQEALRLSPREQLEEQRRSIDFGVCICALSLARFMTDNASDLPPGVVDSLLVHNDALTLLVELIERKPWIRRDKGRTLKYEDAQWAPVPPSDRLVLTKVEAQAWLAVYNLVLDPECRRKYRFDDVRRDMTGRLRRHLHENLVDQLPLLGDLRRVLDQLSVTPPADTPTRPPVRIEAVPELRTRLMQGKAWRRIAEEQSRTVFAATPQQLRAEFEGLAKNYTSQLFQETCERPRCAECGAPATKKCARCKSEWYCSRACQVARWKEHKPHCKAPS
eukprot:gnl/Trimastix_PCT/1299.p2 GENE.gnl/Trimastix_PCT/1299~~gnl/Trimastix_PCT/1299.p2  ORF type:complete len:435 (-),score=135.56 gnl/Trimastix_PCT/1299:590-1894(-)